MVRKKSRRRISVCGKDYVWYILAGDRDYWERVANGGCNWAWETPFLHINLRGQNAYTYNTAERSEALRGKQGTELSRRQDKRVLGTIFPAVSPARSDNSQNRFRHHSLGGTRRGRCQNGVRRRSSLLGSCRTVNFFHSVSAIL